MGWCVDSIQVVYGINDQTLKEMDIYKCCEMIKRMEPPYQRNKRPEDKMCDCPRLGYAYKKANYTVKWSGLEPIRLPICSDESNVIITFFYNYWWEFSSYTNYRFVFNETRSIDKCDSYAEAIPEKRIENCIYKTKDNFADEIIKNSEYLDEKRPWMITMDWTKAFPIDRDSGISYARCFLDIFIQYGPIQASDLDSIKDCCPEDRGREYEYNKGYPYLSTPIPPDTDRGALFENDKTRCSCDNKGIYLKTERLHANIDRDKKFMFELCGDAPVVIISFYYGYISEYGLINKRIIFPQRDCPITTTTTTTTTTIKPPRPSTVTPATARPQVKDENGNAVVIPWAKTAVFPDPVSLLNRNLNKVVGISVGAVILLITAFFAYYLYRKGCYEHSLPPDEDVEYKGK